MIHNLIQEVEEPGRTRLIRLPPAMAAREDSAIQIAFLSPTRTKLNATLYTSDVAKRETAELNANGELTKFAALRHRICCF